MEWGRENLSVHWSKSNDSKTKNAGLQLSSNTPVGLIWVPTWWKVVSIHYLNTTKGNKWMQMWRAVYPSFHQAFFTVPAGLPFWYYSHLDQGRVQKVKKQVYSAWIQPFQDKQIAWIQPFQDFYIFGSLKSWNGWIQAKNPFFPFFAYFEASSHSNYCTDKFVIKNCTNGWKMKKIKEHVFWVFLKKPKTLCKKVLKWLNWLNSRPKSWIQPFQGSPAAGVNFHNSDRL